MRRIYEKRGGVNITGIIVRYDHLGSERCLVNMSSHACHICGKTYSRSDNLKRHIHSAHDSSKPDSPQWQTRHLQSDRRSSDHGMMQHPFTCMISGATGSGKTKWVEQLLMDAQQMITPPPDRIIWCYGQWQPIYDNLMSTVPEIEFYKGIPVQIDSSTFFNKNVNNLFILDDMMTEVRNDPRISNLFSKGSHHLNLSVIYIVQNLFNQGKMARNISLNTQYLVLFKSPRDKQQIMVLARQLYPRRTDNFLKTYEEATKRCYGYLFIDLKPYTPDDQRLKTNILPQEWSLPHPLQVEHLEQATTSGAIQSLSSSVNSFLRGQSYTEPPQVAQVIRLDREIDELLKNGNIPPDQKASLYTQLFLRKQKYLDKVHDISTPVGLTSSPRNNQIVSSDTSETLAEQQLTPRQSPVEPAKIPSTKADSGFGTGRISLTPQDIFRPMRDTILEKRQQLKEQEHTPRRPRENPLISLEDDNDTKRRKIQQAQQTETSEIRQSILTNPESLTKTWITSADDEEVRQGKQRLADRRERKIRQPFTPSDY